jgi:lactate permease
MIVLLATMPLIVAIIMLAVLQRSSLQSGLATVAATIALVLLVPSFRLGPLSIGQALGQGAAASLTVLYVLFPALLLYQVQRATGSIDVLARAVARLCPDREVQVLLLVLGLAPFVESASGFGVGTVVIIPMLMALDMDALQAATLGLMGQLAVPWGALAVGISLGAQLTGIDANTLGAYIALLTIPIAIGFGVAALAFSGGRKRLWRLWPAALLGGLALSAGEWFFSQMPGAELAGVLASIPTILLLAAWGHLAARRSQAKEAEADVETGLVPVLQAGQSKSNQTESGQPEADVETGLVPVLQAEREENQTGASPVSTSRNPMLSAVGPYILLVALLLVSRLVGPVQSWLQAQAILSAPGIGLHFQLIYNPGFYVLLAVVAAAILPRAAPEQLRVALLRTVKQFTPGALAIVSFLAASQIMNDSGMIAVIGASAATLGSRYIWIAPWLGAIGGWLTGSNAGSNAMLAQLQRAVSIRAGLPLYWLMAAQSGAASIATMVSPARTVLATTTCGIVGKEGRLLRRLGPLVLLSVLAIAVLFFVAVRVL